MGRLSKRRGAVSVFLLLIFMVTYVFMGLLVDAGRYRMAQTYVENVLDNASDSLLSNYNKLVFDLYGLFSVDLETENQDELEQKIKAAYETYLDEALGIVQIDSSSYTTELANLIFVDNTATVLDASSLYDFEKDSLEVGTGITLADTANVENQIIEYMKFRAPVQLASDMDGFLSKVNEMLTIKDALEIAIEKNEIVDKYENPATGEPLSEEAQTLLKDINSFAKKLYNYSVNPVLELPAEGSAITKSSEENPYRLLEIAETFDEAIKKACNEYEDERSNVENNYCERLYEELSNLRERMKAANEPEIALSQKYMLDDKEETRNFSEINLMRIDNTDLMELAGEVYEEANKRKDSNKNADSYKKFASQYELYRNAYDAGMKTVKGNYGSKINGAREKLVESVVCIENNADSLKKEINELRDRIESTFTRYENYVNELEAAVESHKEEDAVYQQYLTQYGPTIELAKANGAELVKNLDILLNSRENLEQIFGGYPSEESKGGKEKLSDWVGTGADYVIDKIENPESGMDSSQTLVAMINEYRYLDAAQSENLYCNPYKEAVGALFSNMQGDISTLWSRVTYFYDGNYRSDVDVIVDEEVEENDVSSSGIKDLEEQKLADLSAVDSEKIRENPDWVSVAYTYTPAKDTGSMEVELITGKVDKGFMSNVLSRGKNLLCGLEKLLKGARDNLYVDAYVMSMFSNYQEWNTWKSKGTSELKCLNVPYEDGETSYNASFAEVEYIITGAEATLNGDGTASKGVGEKSVEAMRTKLFGTRMMFNTLSILLDEGKVLQAQSLSACAGLLAPLVTVILLAAWAAMESVIDVMVLMGDIPKNCQTETIKSDMEQGVVIYKGSQDWYFSTAGIVKALAGGVLKKLESGVLEKADELIGSLETKTNVLIYDAYTSTQTTMDGIFEEIKIDEAQEITSWGTELTDKLDEVDGFDLASLTTMKDSLDTAKNAFSKADEVADEVKGQLDSTLASAKEQAVIAVSRMSKEASKSVKQGMDSLTAKAKGVINQNIDKIIPVGKVVNGGSNANKVRMNYKDYLYFYLFTMKQSDKVCRIQSVIQANMRVGGQTNFSMERSPVSVWADLECSMRYLFLSNGIVPESMKRDGRLRFKVISAQSY